MAAPVRSIHDPAVPAASILISPEHRELLGVLAEAAAGDLGPSRLRQVRYVPGKSITAQYDVEIERDDTTEQVTIVAASGIPVPDGVMRLEAGGIEVALWAFPHDPFLPGLAPATDPVRVAELLNALGAPTGAVRLRRRAYRAGRRAVIEARGDAAAVYLKVIRPNRVADLQELHRTMAAVLPVPNSLGWSGELGIVAMQALPGSPLRRAVAAGADLPSPVALLSLLDRIPAVHRDGPPPPVRRVPAHTRLLGAVMPELRPRLDMLVRATSSVASEPIVPVHGDFHAGQILTRNGTVTGLVDVDTVGRGNRSDDLAGLLAQLSTLSLMDRRSQAFDRYGAELIAAFDRVVDPASLRLRVAASIVGFATGPFRVQAADWPTQTNARIALAERWVASADGATSPHLTVD